MIPEYTKQSIDRFVSHGIPPGSFVQAVLENDLMRAFSCADSTNTEYMRDIVSYVYNSVPSACHGSPEKVEAWADRMAERLNKAVG